MRTGKAGVRQVGCASRKDLLVGGLHVGMGSNHCRNRAIEHTPHGDLLRGRLTMEIDEDHFGGRSQPSHLGLGEQEGIFHGRHERPRLKV